MHEAVPVAKIVVEDLYNRVLKQIRGYYYTPKPPCSTFKTDLSMELGMFGAIAVGAMDDKVVLVAYNDRVSNVAMASVCDMSQPGGLEEIIKDIPRAIWFATRGARRKPSGRRTYAGRLNLGR